MNIAELPNIGSTSADWLRSAGIRTRAELEAAGPVGAYLAVRDAGHRPSLNLLSALATGLRGLHWTALPAHVKARLQKELAAAES
jgi:hypothetical protein